MADNAEELMESGQVGNAVMQDGKVMVKNQINGNWEPYNGQPVQSPDGNYGKDNQ